jgi:putative ABC transport system ATP-binding protein
MPPVAGTRRFVVRFARSFRLIVSPDHFDFAAETCNSRGSSGPEPHGGAVVEPVIALKDVSLTLGTRAGPVEILRSVDLSVAPAESVAIVGPSGSGKTSLLMVIAGLERASRGRVAVAGHELGGLDEDALALVRGANIGIVFQSFHLVPTMTALENVALPLELAGKPDAFPAARALLEEVGLSHRADHFPAQLSGGEQQRVAVARALSPRPQILLADEPTGNLDGRTGEHVADLLFDLQRRRAATLVLVTHETALARRCGRIVHMADGAVAREPVAA